MVTEEKKSFAGYPTPSEWVSVPGEPGHWELVGVPMGWHIILVEESRGSESLRSGWALHCFHRGPHTGVFGNMEVIRSCFKSSAPGGHFDMGAQDVAYLWRSALVRIYTEFETPPYEEWYNQYFTSVHTGAVEASQMIPQFQPTFSPEEGDDLAGYERRETERVYTTFCRDIAQRTDRRLQLDLESKSVKRQIAQALDPHRPTLQGVADWIEAEYKKNTQGDEPPSTPGLDPME